MMNNHFHLQHEHTPPNVAPQFLQHASTNGSPTAASPYNYGTGTSAIQVPTQLSQPAQQWMAYQIMPPIVNAGNGSGDSSPGNKRYYATPTASQANTIQITNNYAQTPQQLATTNQRPTPAAIVSASGASPFKAGNNIRIISTAPNSLYSINNAAAPASAELFAPLSSNSLQSYYLPSAGNGASAASSLTRIMANANNAAKILPTQHQQATPPPPLVPVSGNNNSGVTGTSSTVVLDRINICINNHYAEAAVPVPSLCSTQSQAQQPSPIIPAIQHKALLPPAPLIDSSSAADSSCSSTSSLSRSSGTPISNAVVIDEPDSTTTTPNTPPTTPETLSSPIKTTEVLTSQSSPTVESFQLKQSYQSEMQLSAALLTPPTPPPTADSPTAIRYELEEDVFIKCSDGRFYLGTVIEHSEEQYLIRFDDKSEQWCESEKLRKLGTSSTHSSNSPTTNGPMCVACKRDLLEDVVEICERCGRGYHRNCTTETILGSGIWNCKRCCKPMKMQKPLSNVGKPPGICRQLPYHAEKLSWDNKHRVNEEQIYCYCGKAGKFDHNMLQCCKCRNWFHTECMQNFKRKLLRGDIFFVFCCTVCNDGKEFVRRLQIDWIDVLHITLYNLRKHQHQKYHHLIKDIWPFVLKHRDQFPICSDWRNMPETSLMESIKKTLKENTNRFVCGRELKRAPAYYALRLNTPPLTPEVFMQPHDELSTKVLVEKFKLTVLPENDIISKITKDVYEFPSDEDVDVEADTSEDEIPIKQIMEKAKKQQQSESVNKLVVAEMADDNANDGQPSKAVKPAPVSDMQSRKLLLENSSRKRKAFRLSKSYNDMTAKRRDYSNRNNHCDLSSDENSSSSRGTSSLDLIIPPPANFRGRNNPFLMTTPKKPNDAATHSQLRHGVGSAVGIINRIFKLNSSAGIFTKLSTIELSKAAAQPRMVRTIKRRLSAKDITIGPNQEVRRRRTRRLTTTAEVIHTTTINPIPSHYFPIYAKDLQSLQSSSQSAAKLPPPEKPSTHGRLLRQRQQQKADDSPDNSRRSSTSSTATNVSGSTETATNSGSSSNNSIKDLKQTVNKYFGGVLNRIDAGELFAIRAKRRLIDGQVQYLVEWGGDAATTNGNSSNGNITN